MTHQNLSSDLDPDEPRLSGGSAHLWIGAVIAALLLLGTVATVVVLRQSDDIANRWIVGEHPTISVAAP